MVNLLTIDNDVAAGAETRLRGLLAGINDRLERIEGHVRGQSESAKSLFNSALVRVSALEHRIAKLEARNKAFAEAAAEAVNRFEAIKAKMEAGNGKSL